MIIEVFCIIIYSNSCQVVPSRANISVPGAICLQFSPRVIAGKMQYIIVMLEQLFQLRYSPAPVFAAQHEMVS